MKQNDAYHEEADFDKDIILILKKAIEEKLPDFLDFCVHTHNAEPIKQVIYFVSVYKFNAKRN